MIKGWKNIEGLGKKIKWMDLEFIFTLVELYIQENSKMENNMDAALTNSQMELYMKDNGKTIE